MFHDVLNSVCMWRRLLSTGMVAMVAVMAAGPNGALLHQRWTVVLTRSNVRSLTVLDTTSVYLELLDMSLCVCTCMCVCVCICMCVCVCVCVCVCTCMCVLLCRSPVRPLVYVQVSVHVYLLMCVYMYVCLCVHVRGLVSIMCACMYVLAYNETVPMHRAYYVKFIIKSFQSIHLSLQPVL